MHIRPKKRKKEALNKAVGSAPVLSLMEAPAAATSLHPPTPRLSFFCACSRPSAGLVFSAALACSRKCVHGDAGNRAGSEALRAPHKRLNSGHKRSQVVLFQLWGNLIHQNLALWSAYADVSARHLSKLSFVLRHPASHIILPLAALSSSDLWTLAFPKPVFVCRSCLWTTQTFFCNTVSTETQRNEHNWTRALSCAAASSP